MSANTISQNFCDWCDAEDVEITHVVDLDRFGFNGYFCSLQCAARWGCAADQDKIQRVSEREERETP